MAITTREQDVTASGLVEGAEQHGAFWRSALDVIGKRYWYFLLSLLIILPGAVSLAFPPHLKLGIEFSAGTEMTLSIPKEISQSELRNALTDLGYGDAQIQRSDQDWLLRTRPISEEQRDAQGNVVAEGGQSERTKLINDLQSKLGVNPITVRDFATISPVVAGEIVRASVIAVIVATIFILGYLTFAFRKLKQPWRYGVCAIIALVHDVLVVLGIFSILGRLLGVEIDALFITALLTVIGFSVHDTIVVFDRIRENLTRNIAPTYAQTVNHSILQTLGRSINTSLTVIFTLLALYLFGGVTIRTFVLALLIGIISGTYSSIFNASQLLVVWHYREWNRWFKRGGGDDSQPRTAPA